MQRGEVSRARALLYDVLRANPSHLPALMRLTQLEVAAGQPNSAVAWVEKAIEHSPEALEPKVLLARVHLQSRNPRGALDLTAPLLGRHPGNLPLREVIGRAQLMLGRPAEAVLTLRPLAEAMAGSAEAQLLLAAAYRAARDEAGVRRQLDRVLEIDPANVGAKIQLASLLAGQGELDRAEELVAELRADGPERSDVLELAGGIALLRSRPADAVAAYQAALAKRPTGALTIKLAMAQQRAGDSEDAVATLRDWITRSPEDLDARSLLGVQYVALKRLEAAEAIFLEMLEIDPNNVVALNNLALVALRLGRPDDALTYGRRAAELAPNDAAVMDTLGTALLGAEKADEALPVLEKAAQGMPDNPEVRYHLAQALARSGEVSRARDVLRGALASAQPFDERPEAEKLLKVLED
jgi:putative PEP-CTERM system TPR-repeat lipoprotein